MRSVACWLFAISFICGSGIGCGKSGQPPIPASVTVSGKVLAEGGKSTKNLMMILSPTDEAIKMAPMQSRPLSEKGEFTFECPPGKYRVNFAAIPKQGGAMEGGLPPAEAPKEAAAWSQVQLSFTVPEGGKTGVELKVP